MKAKINRYLVGGAVRDRLLGLPVTERDWVVVGATPEIMQTKGFRPVGQDFPVFLDPATGEEHALARTERKNGRGYGGFIFHASPEITLEEDLQRRDLTVNAMAESEDGALIDPYGGLRDLEARLLRHVSPAFAEDPLRVLRVARFAARYAGLGFRIAPETMTLMRELASSGELQTLTAERSWKEISRALMESRPEVFLQVLDECGALAELFPELKALFQQASPLRAYKDRAGYQLTVLHNAAAMELPLAARWTALLQGFADSQPRPADGLAAVRAINQRCKVPRDCADLAQMGCLHLADFRAAMQLDGRALGQLFRALDIYRRADRFELFVAAAEAEQRLHTNDTLPSAQGMWLREAAGIARAVPVQPLLGQGLTGGALGEALEQAREAALQQACRRRGLPEKT
jgi:tRNA nucleotidyltransferase (CCA-adding enzyme)